MVTRTRGRRWMAIRAGVLSESPLCVACQRAGRIRIADEVDHILPLHKGGTDDTDNLQALCTECHADKTARDAGHARKPEIGLDGWPL